jgi:hypothetical protein
MSALSKIGMSVLSLLVVRCGGCGSRWMDVGLGGDIEHANPSPQDKTFADFRPNFANIHHDKALTKALQKRIMLVCVVWPGIFAVGTKPDSP